MVAVAHLEQLAEPSEVIDNCADNVQLIISNVQALNQSISTVLGMDDVGYSANGAPERPNTDKLNRSAWLYVVAVMRWCQRVISDSAEFGADWGLTDGDTDETIWIPYTTLVLNDDFQVKINHSWELIDSLFDQLFENYKILY